MKKGGFLIASLLTVFILLLVILIFLVAYYQFSESSSDEENTRPQEITSNSGYDPETSSDCDLSEDEFVIPDFEKLKKRIEEDPIIKDTPSSGRINLMFYHFYGDCRVWDKVYFINKNTVYEGEYSSDIDLFLHSDYIPGLISGDLCSVLSEARKNGDQGEDLKISKSKLAFKYRSLLKYRDCLGL